MWPYLLLDPLQSEVPSDKMTYRTNPKSGEKVALLGYGCMRWPLLPSPDGNGNVVDQEAVNELIDYAIAHGVNYFDASPVYIQDCLYLYRQMIRTSGSSF